MRIDDRFQNTVLFIGGLRPTGEFVPYGTAFLVTIAIGPTTGFHYVVTAKHVQRDIENSGLIPGVRLNSKGRAAHIAQLQTTWYFHPTIPGLDIAVAPIQISNELFEAVHIEINCFVTDPLTKDLDIGCGDEVYTIGLLTRRIGELQNIPVVRIGNICAMPDEPVDLGEENGRHFAYLIESRSIGGLSGSPVFWHTPNHRVLNKNLTALVGRPDAYLLGINIGLFETMAHADRLPGERPKRSPRLLGNDERWNCRCITCSAHHGNSQLHRIGKRTRGRNEKTSK